MSHSVTITDLRANLFELTEQLVKEGGELLIKKDNKILLKITPVVDDKTLRTKKAIESLKLLGGTITSFDTEFFHGKKEVTSTEQLGSWSDQKV